MRIMGLASFFVCIVLMENAILQASGKERLPMIALITGSLVKIAVNWVIIAIPSINIYGAPVGTLIGYLCMAVLDYIFIRRALNQNPNLLKAFGKPLLCSLAMGASAVLIYRLADLLLHGAGKIGLALSMLLAIAAAVAVYLIAVIRTRCITGEDLRMIPGGARVGSILHIR